MPVDGTIRKHPHYQCVGCGLFFSPCVSTNDKAVWRNASAVDMIRLESLMSFPIMQSCNGSFHHHIRVLLYTSVRYLPESHSEWRRSESSMLLPCIVFDKMGWLQKFRGDAPNASFDSPKELRISKASNSSREVAICISSRRCCD